MHLVRPAAEHLASYRSALERSWSPSTTDPGLSRVELDRIDTDPAAFLAGKDDPHASGQPITLPDGSVVARLPGFQRCVAGRVRGRDQRALAAR